MNNTGSIEVTDAMGIPDERLTVVRLTGPSHAGEVDFGFALERRNKRWYWVVTGEFAGPSGTTRHSEAYLLPEDFFVGLTWETFTSRLIDSVSPYPTLSRNTNYSKCPDAKKIERLFC